MASTAAAEVPRLVGDLRAIVRRLEELFHDRRFTLDGHLLGSIGEVLAAHDYDLSLLPMSERCHDATAGGGTIHVQIKVTQGRVVALREEPDHLLVLRLTDSGGTEEIYNGPGRPVWEKAGRMQRNGQRPIGVAKLRTLMATVPPDRRLPRVRG
jgi:hypothetical protein